MSSDDGIFFIAKFVFINGMCNYVAVICTQACVILLPRATVIFALCASDIATSLQLRNI